MSDRRRLVYVPTGNGYSQSAYATDAEEREAYRKGYTLAYHDPRYLATLREVDAGRLPESHAGVALASARRACREKALVAIIAKRLGIAYKETP
jgi:hypothetical protein